MTKSKDSAQNAQAPIFDEIFRPIEGFEGHYEVSNLGNVKTIKFGRNRNMSTAYDNDGYKLTGLTINGIAKTCKVHRLVAKAFIPNPLNLPIVNHINSKRDDNRVDNLEWCTESYNAKHSFLANERTGMLGEKHPMSTISDSNVMLMRNDFDNGLFCVKTLSDKYSVSSNVTWNIVSNRTFRHLPLCSRYQEYSLSILELNKKRRDDAIEIRKRISLGESALSLRKEFGIPITSFKRIINNISYQNL